MAATSSPAHPFGSKTLEHISVDEINDTYKEGFLTKKARDDMIRRKAAEVLDNTIRDQGMVKTYFSEMIKHVQANWDDTVQAFKDYKPYEATGKEKGSAGEKANEALQRLGLSFKVMQNEIGALIAPFQAFGDVNGATAEHWAASAGASEGLAKTIGLAVNVGSNFVPIGKASQSFAKGVQGWAELAKGAGKAGEAIGQAGKVSNLATAGKAAEKALSAADDAMRQGLEADGVRVFHGSPHEFQQFDISKVGTGQGAQSYGHGLYLAEHPSVAGDYQKMFSTAIPDIEGIAAKAGLTLSSDARIELMRQAGVKAKSASEAAKSLQNASRELRDVPVATLSKVIEDFRSASGGHLYTAKIPEGTVSKMLDWDKPLSEQAPEVKNIITRLQNEAPIRKPIDRVPLREDAPAGVIYDALKDRFGSGEATSKALADAGIPGIKYLDQGSRTAGQGTRNFVVFDPAILGGTERLTGGMKQAEELSNVDKFYKNLRAYHREIKDVTETKHLKDIEAEADALGIHLDDLKALGQGTALTPAQIRAYLKTLDEPTTDLIANARDVLKGVPEAGPIQDKLLMDYFSYTPKFRAAEVQAGRTVKVLDSDPRMKSITEMMKGWDPENAAGLNFDAVRRTIAEDLVAMANSPEKLKNLQIQTASGVIDKNSPTVWRRIKEAYSGILLMAPPTWIKNFMGNVFAATSSTVEREIAGAFSIDAAKGVVKGEGLTQLQGYTAAMGEALHAFGQSFKTMAPGEVTKFDFMPHANSGPLGRVLNVGHDVLRGTDNFFKTILRNGDLWATTFRDGKHLGLEGDALVDYAMRHRAMPSSTLLAHADDFALTQTYQNDLGTIGKMVQKATQNSPFYFWFPYTKTPMNLGKYAWYRTPGIQLFSESLYADIIAGGERADMAIARLTMGNMMGAFWFGLHRQGVLTDGGPLNPALRRAWSAMNQPYAWRSKDGTQYPLPQMEPLTTSINLMSDFSAILNQLDEPTAGQAAMAMALSATKDIADKTYWQTVGQMFDVLGSVRAGEQPGPAVQRLAVSPLLAVTTGGALPGRAARIMDPVQREARGFVDQWKRRIPGYSETLPPMRDGYGDPILPPVSLGADWLGMLQPFTFKPPEGDRIKKEGEKLQVKLPIFPWNIGGPNRDTFDIREADPTDPLPVPLTPEQRDRWQRLYRDQLRHPDYGIEKMLDSPKYKSQTIPERRELFTNALAKMRAQAKNMLVATDPELQKAVLQSKAAGVLPMLQPDDRPQAQAAIDQAIGQVDDLSAEAKDNLMKWGYSADPGAERDQEVIRGYRGEINKSIPELNRGAAQESNPPPPAE